ncbi:hypothetical protein ERO13_A13G064566v2 [Gossypium hirsutum]|uniref:NAC domain-containing protein n=2 Tax=Gossypium TaxID=3633 RepID=A0A5J5T1M2_GOSBA|nr:hypothetical protein ES319_A13G069500v1 [Gossypium barbadense]KAG4165205.1 hypothetical protein ERO13_A13G064566v2 [Gossypium hirsutum]TYG85641.1 hypothetical protein ES288_A13G071500v1 [Gossypium darwinii]
MHEPQICCKSCRLDRCHSLRQKRVGYLPIRLHTRSQDQTFSISNDIPEHDCLKRFLKNSIKMSYSDVFNEHEGLSGFKYGKGEEILFDNLKPIIKGDPIPSGVLKTRHIYGANREPWNIFDQELPESFWVLTKLKKKSKSRIERTTGDGCWLQQFAKEVKNKDGGEVIGYDKYFTYTSKKNKKSNGQWIMHEFSLKEQEAVGLSDLVICEIKNKDAAALSSDYEESKGEIKKNKKRKLMEVPSDSTNDFATVPVENQTFDYMAPEVGGFSPFSACLDQQPNPWTSAGVGGNLGVPDYNSHHLVPA